MKYFLIFTMLIYFNLQSYGQSQELLVQTSFAFLYQKANIFSPIVNQLREGQKVTLLKQHNNWYFVQFKGNKGFIHKKYLIKKLQPVDENIYKVLNQKKKNLEINTTKKDFSEDEEISAVTKGFSEDEEISAVTKGFSEDEEISAVTKGFSEDEEISAVTKGFSENEEISAVTKGFSEDEEISAVTKGFSKKKTRKISKNQTRLKIIFLKYYKLDSQKMKSKHQKILKKIK